jgi:hypothetical protein
MLNEETMETRMKGVVTQRDLERPRRYGTSAEMISTPPVAWLD